MISGPSKKGLYVFLIFLFILFDRILKSILIRFPSGEPLIVFVPGLFKVQTLFNRGIAFGLFQRFSQEFLLINIVIISYLLYLFFRNKKENLYFPLSLILSGALSNLTDRFLYGGVLDYLNLSFWPTFNLADVFISLGILLVIKDVFFGRKEV